MVEKVSNHKSSRGLDLILWGGMHEILYMDGIHENEGKGRGLRPFDT